MIRPSYVYDPATVTWSWWYQGQGSTLYWYQSVVSNFKVKDAGPLWIDVSLLFIWKIAQCHVHNGHIIDTSFMVEVVLGPHSFVDNLNLDLRFITFKLVHQWLRGQSRRSLWIACFVKKGKHSTTCKWLQYCDIFYCGNTTWLSPQLKVYSHKRRGSNLSELW